MKIDRRGILLGIAGSLLSTLPAYGASGRTRYNFSSNSYSGDTRRNTAQRRPAPVYAGKELVDYDTIEAPGTIIVATKERALYLVLEDGFAMRYGVGVGRQGATWKGVAHIRHKRTWPDWYPTENIRKREWEKYRRKLPKMVKGGLKNPLGARALYLFQGNRDTLYRIHGTNNPASIGHAQSSGCIRLLNEEIIDLHDRVSIDAKVIVT